MPSPKVGGSRPKPKRFVANLSRGLPTLDSNSLRKITSRSELVSPMGMFAPGKIKNL